MNPARSWCVLVVLALASAAAAQDPVPSGAPQVPAVEFHVEVNYVEVDVRVLDTGGRFVRGLTKDDFEVREDGVVQRIDRFALVDIPIDPPEQPPFLASPLDADVASNARAYDGRLYLIVLDDLHVAPLRTQAARQAARTFLETRLGANDQAAVITTRGAALDRQGFTSNRGILLEAVDRFVGRKLPPEAIMAVDTPEVVDSQQEETRFAPGSDPIALQRALDARAALTTLRNAADFMAGVRGRRKALIFISEGIDYDIHDVFDNQEAPGIVATSRDAIAAATRANVAIYGIDPRGLTALGDDIAALRGQPAGEPGATAVQALLRSQQMAHDSLRELSELTGGFATVNEPDIGGAFDRIVAENSSYYVLAYSASNPRREGRSRRIDVRVRRPGVQVYARDGYIEPRAGVSERPELVADVPAGLLEALRSPLPLTGLTLSATAAAFQGTDGRASVPVVVEIRGDQLGLLREGETYTGRLDVAVWAAGARGGPGISAHRQASLNLGPATYQRVQAYGLKVLLRLELPPDRYQLRIAAVAADIAARGSVFYDLDVPDFSGTALSMSHVLLTSAASSRALAVKEDLPVSALLPAAPTANREFQRGDRLAVLAEVYDTDRRPHEVDISSSILTAAGQPVFTAAQRRSSRELGDDPTGSYGVVYEVPLASFAPGLYVLRIRAESLADRPDRTEPLVRDVPFRVVP